jgi:peptidoglycan hydrolase-like protein with peptidoglycan-binding domain
MKQTLLFLAITLCSLSFAQADETIRSLQQLLKDQGFYFGRVTGDKSGETTAAIRRYQIRNGLQVTGELNEETLRSVKPSSNSVATAPRPTSKVAVAQPNSVRLDASGHVSQSSAPPSFSQSDRPLQINPSYSASFYQSPKIRVNRQLLADVQYQLMSRGYYRGRVDGRYGRQMAFALQAFQSSAGLSPTGRLDIQTVEALGSPDTEIASSAPTPRGYETWSPVRKFKNGKWKLKWKKNQRDRDDIAGDEDQQAISAYGALGY